MPQGHGSLVPAGPLVGLPLNGLQRTAASIARPGRPATAEATGTGAELAYVRDILTELQRVSFRENREYCGYIGLDPSGRLMRTDLSAGVEAGCALPVIPSGMRALASFHTHSTYSPLYASEFPTTQDMRSDSALGVDGYISTPGGRLWYVDSDTMTVRQICGRGCLPQDPNYRPEDDGPVRPQFTFDELARFERGML
ncbi:protein of unknown function [Wenxinia saemankumensis]|uniref:DUF4329 domain-containing protein n=1 Tax=Wenxinia saemankumensis TaxID=1447782 RepID=A0A1M6FJL5_9RHOB|nr:protein of unknown function [Wenxinia saemankumensis]